MTRPSNLAGARRNVMWLIRSRGEEEQAANAGGTTKKQRKKKHNKYAFTSACVYSFRDGGRWKAEVQLVESQLGGGHTEQTHKEQDQISLDAFRHLFTSATRLEQLFQR